MPTTRPPYAPEFRQQMVDLVRAGRDPQDLAREFEPSAQAIRNWVADADCRDGRREPKPATADTALTATERDELARLRRETNGQVERMNRTIKDATVKRFHYDDHEQLRCHLADFISAYNFGRRLKTLKGLTPYEFICNRWTAEPERFNLNPLQQMLGLNI